MKFSKNNNKINEKEENTSKENNRTPPPSRYNKLCPEQKVYYSTTPNPIVKLRLFHTKTNPKHPKIKNQMITEKYHGLKGNSLHCTVAVETAFDLSSVDTCLYL